MAIYAYRYNMAAHVRVTDEDAADFLQSQFSNDLRPFSAGQATYGLWLDVKGKVIADSWVYCLGAEEFLIYSEYSSGEEIADKLQRHIIADDVEIEVLPAAPALSLIGEGAVQAASEGKKTACVFSGNRSALPSMEMIFRSETDREAFVESKDFECIPRNRMHRERIKAGVPMVPLELGSDDLPGEGGLERTAVSFTKGCFLGQEVVARMHHVGRPQRGLFRVSGSTVPGGLPVTLSNEAGKSVGELRSAYPEDSAWVGVAILKKRHVSIGSRLFAEGVEVVVGEPFSADNDISQKSLQE
jgi:folate-binding protein YgfZ